MDNPDTCFFCDKIKCGCDSLLADIKSDTKKK